MRASQSIAFAAILAVFCSCSNSGTAQPTGQSCAKVTDCYSGQDAGALRGEVVCLDLTNGYCSHTCTTDSDCCAIPGECPAGVKQVCAPLESNPQTYCFVSCETADIAPGADGGTDPNAHCAAVAGSGFTCRSTGGGVANKKFCGP